MSYHLTDGNWNRFYPHIEEMLRIGTDENAMLLDGTLPDWITVGELLDRKPEDYDVDPQVRERYEGLMEARNEGAAHWTARQMSEGASPAPARRRI